MVRISFVTTSIPLDSSSLLSMSIALGVGKGGWASRQASKIQRLAMLRDCGKFASILRCMVLRHATVAQRKNVLCGRIPDEI
jgi:hypothetical protein